MNTAPHDNPQDLLDAYLDGSLGEVQHRDFEARLEQDPGLRREVEVQMQMDASLKRCHSTPDIDTLLTRAHDTADEPLRLPRWFIELGRIAALVAIGVMSTLLVQRVLGPGDEAHHEEEYAVVGLTESYHYVLEEGFEPLWRCETDEEFADTFEYRLGHPLVLGAVPTGVEAIGLSYSPAISYSTIALLATVDGQKVIVFVDHTEIAEHQQPELTDPDLHLFQRQVDDLMLYEVTPLDKPKLLDSFKIPDDHASTDHGNHP